MEPSGDSTPQGRDVTLDEALEMAVRFQQRGQLAEAEEVYRTILSAVPDEPVALHYSGVLAHQLDRQEEALALIELSLTLEPGRADWHSNLGIVLKAEGRADEAADAFRRAITLSPTHVNAHSNLGVMLKAQGRHAEAEAAYRRAIELDPNHVDAHHNLGVLLSATGRAREAVLCYCKVTTLSPHHKEARRLMALAHCTLGEDDKAIAIFEEWLAEEPENPVAQHMLAACSGRGVPARASDAFVEKVFDDFASSFDSKLAGLHYRAPALVEAVLRDTGIPARQQLDVLDAGCGTGLCGPLVAPWARRLVGVDLSAKMLARAQHRLAPSELAPLKHVYDELCHAELTAYLQAHPNEFDLIVSADTLVYFGDLSEVIPAAAATLRDGGTLIFSLEDAASPAGEPGSPARERGSPEDAAPFHIDAHGRYAHRPNYVERTLAAAGLESQIVRAELRMEAGVPVKGLLVRATKGGLSSLPRAASLAGAQAVTHG